MGPEGRNTMTTCVLASRKPTLWWVKWGLCALRHGIQKINGSHFGLQPCSHPQNDWTPGWQNGVNDDVCAQAPITARFMQLSTPNS